MNYFWGTCGGCGCQVTIQFADAANRLTGSLRRWSTDRSVNDGRRMEIPRSEVGADGGFQAACVCEAIVAVAGAAIEHAATEPLEAPAGRR
jgi:hypothetical protein